jgi:hypothetical protein
MLTIKKLMIMGLMGTAIISLQAMEESKNSIIKYGHSWSTPVLVINELFGGMPKEVANYILLCMWHSELKPTAERVHWVTQLNQQHTGLDDKTLDSLRIRVMFFNEEEKKAVSLLTDAFIPRPPHMLKKSEYKPLKEVEYKEILAMMSLVDFRKKLSFGANKVVVIEEESKLQQVISGSSIHGNNPISASIYGSVAGVALYCHCCGRSGANFSLGMSMSCAAIGAGVMGASTLLGNLLNVRVNPSQSKIIKRSLLTEKEEEEFKKKKAIVAPLCEKISKKVSKQVSKQVSKNNFRLQNRE